MALLFNQWRNQPYNLSSTQIGETWGSNCKFEPAMIQNQKSNTDTDNGHEKVYLPTGTDNGHGSRIYGFTVASYDKTKDLIIDPLLASTYLGGSDWDYGNSLPSTQAGTYM